MEDAVEMIDIGGPSMLRAAAKNFAHVAPVSGPEQYARVLAELRENGAVSQATRRALAADAFATSAAYEAAIARWFAEGEGLPDTLSLAFEKVQDLAYGENPHQRAAYYREVGARRPLLSHVEQLHGRELSFNNLHDLSGALHAAPRVHAAGLRDRQARERMRRRRRRDDRGGVRARARIRPALRVRDGLRAQPARDGRARRHASREQFVDVLFAPDYEDGALDAWSAKPQTRILADRERRAFPPDELDYKRMPGGLLVQDRDWDVDDARDDERRRRLASPRSSGATCCSRGACASTSRRTRS